LVDDGAGAGGTFLSLKAKCGGGHAFDSGVEVGIGVNDDGIFSTHLEDRALDPFLAGTVRGGTLVDVKPDLLRAGESNKAGLRMLDQAGAEAGAGAGAEIHNAVGHAGFLQDLKKLGSDGR